MARPEIVTINRQHAENIERLASLETDVRNLSQDVRSLAQSVQVLADRMSARERPNWQMLGVAIVLVGAIGTAVITPLTRDVAANDRYSQMRTDAQEAQIQDLRKLLAERDAALHGYVDVEVARVSQQGSSGLEQRMQEIETQFRWMTDVTNVREREADRKISLLWRKAYGEELPIASLPDVGPRK